MSTEFLRFAFMLIGILNGILFAAVVIMYQKIAHLKNDIHVMTGICENIGKNDLNILQHNQEILDTCSEIIKKNTELSRCNDILANSLATDSRDTEYIVPKKVRNNKPNNKKKRY